MVNQEFLPVSYVIVLTTMPDLASAQQMANELIEESLAACVNILPEMRSIYRWKDEIQQGNEHQLIIKTCASEYENVENWIKNKHPYELPEILAVPIQRGLEGYLGWVSDNCGNTE
jgi:periplasmic divalent cation tolerance protein